MVDRLPRARSGPVRSPKTRSISAATPGRTATRTSPEPVMRSNCPSAASAIATLPLPVRACTFECTTPSHMSPLPLASFASRPPIEATSISPDPLWERSLPSTRPSLIAPEPTRTSTSPSMRSATTSPEPVAVLRRERNPSTVIGPLWVEAVSCDPVGASTSRAISTRRKLRGVLTRSRRRSSENLITRSSSL